MIIFVQSCLKREICFGRKLQNLSLSRSLIYIFCVECYTTQKPAFVKCSLFYLGDKRIGPNVKNLCRGFVNVGWRQGIGLWVLVRELSTNLSEVSQCPC